MVKCPQCKGTGEINYKVTTHGTGETTEGNMECHVCDGEKEITELQAKAIEEQNKLWCKCEEPTFGSYPEDGECECGMNKHHVHCGICGKISQIG
jgi:hypothetical protein